MTPNVTLFALDGDQVVRGEGFGAFSLAMGQGVTLAANNKPGDIITPPDIRFPSEVRMETSFDADADIFRVLSPPPGPPEKETQIVMEAPTAGEVDVNALTEAVDTARARDSELIVLLKRDVG